MLRQWLLNRDSVWAALGTFLLNALLLLPLLLTRLGQAPISGTLAGVTYQLDQAGLVVGPISLPFGCYQVHMARARIQPGQDATAVSLPTLHLEAAPDCLDASGGATGLAKLSHLPGRQLQLEIEQFSFSHPGLPGQYRGSIKATVGIDAEQLNLDGQVSIQGEDMALSLQLEQARWQATGQQWQTRFVLDARGDLPLADGQQGMGTFTASGRLSGSEQTVELAPGARLSIDRLQLGQVLVDSGRFTTLGPLSIPLDAPRLPPLALASQGVTVTLPGQGTLRFDGRHRIRQQADRWQHSHQVELHQASDQSIKSQLDINAHSTLPPAMQHRVTIDWGLDQAEQALLLPYLGPWLRSKQVVPESGQVLGRVSLSIKPQVIRYELEAWLTQLNVRWGEVGARDVSGLLVLAESTWPQWRLAGLGGSRNQFAAREFTWGITLQDVETTLQGDAATLRLMAPSARMDQIAVQANWLPLVPQPGTAWIRLSNLPLSLLAELYPKVFSQASGVLRADVPLQYRAEGFLVNDGQISLSEPGCVRSDALAVSADGGKGIPGADMLSEFCFDKLSSYFSLQPDGEFELKARIEGSSPVNSQQLRLNYSHQENLLQLWRSYRMATRPDSSIPGLSGGQP